MYIECGVGAAPRTRTFLETSISIIYRIFLFTLTMSQINTYVMCDMYDAWCLGTRVPYAAPSLPPSPCAAVGCWVLSSFLFLFSAHFLVLFGIFTHRTLYDYNYVYYFVHLMVWVDGWVYGWRNAQIGNVEWDFRVTFDVRRGWHSARTTMDFRRLPNHYRKWIVRTVAIASNSLLPMNAHAK